jgi:hypothetical protein
MSKARGGEQKHLTYVALFWTLPSPQTMWAATYTGSGVVSFGQRFVNHKDFSLFEVFVTEGDMQKLSKVNP